LTELAAQGLRQSGVGIQELLAAQQRMEALQGAKQTVYGFQEIRDKHKIKKRSFMKLFKDYLEAHRDTIFTLVLILLADHYVFNGAFRETISDAFKKLLDKAHQKIDGLPTSVVKNEQ
jgi:hypothetical protein